MVGVFFMWLYAGKEVYPMKEYVEAANPAQAREIAERNWKNSEYILDADHFKGVTAERSYNRRTLRIRYLPPY